MKSGSKRIAVNAPSADLAHQVHPHTVSAQCEKGAVSEAEDAGISPDQIEAQCQERVAQVLAQKRDQVIGHCDSGVRWHPKVEGRDDQNQDPPAAEKDRPKAPAPRAFLLAAGVHRHGLSLRLGSASLEREEAARPALDEQYDRHQHDDFAEDCPGDRLEEFVDNAQ